MTNTQEQHRTKTADPLFGHQTGPIDTGVGSMGARHSGPTDWKADRCSLTLALLPDSVAVGRRSVRTTMACWNLDNLSADVELLTSELVTNAVDHARALCATPDDPGLCHLTLEQFKPGSVVVSVMDSSSRRPKIKSPSKDDESGRGLQVVKELADRWGVRSTPTGKVVWAEVRLETRDGPPARGRNHRKGPSTDTGQVSGDVECAGPDADQSASPPAPDCRRIGRVAASRSAGTATPSLAASSMRSR